VDTIIISDLEVSFRVGVPDQERRYSQRLLLTVEMQGDFSKAAKTDSITETVDYFAVSQAVLKFGEGREWRLIEKLAADVAEMILTHFSPAAVMVEVKKFVIPQAQFVAVRVTRERVY
jgi:7,8-dihydroneopterin aldolase/epimerase/oxygenase